MHKKLFFILILCIALTGCSQADTTKATATPYSEIPTQGQFAIIDGIPFAIYEGNVYEYKENDNWEPLSLTGEAKQLVSVKLYVFYIQTAAFIMKAH